MIKKINKYLVITLFFVVFAYGVFSLIKIISTFAPDFSVYYYSALNLVNRKNIYLDSTLYTGLGYPPNTLLLYLPFLLMPYKIAQGLWAIASFMLLFIAVHATLNLFGSKSWLAMLMVWILMFLAFPTRFSLGMGQANIVALFVLVILLKYLKTKQNTKSGVMLALLTLIKPHFILLSAVFLLLKQWKIIIVSTSLQVISIIATGVMFGWFQYSTYLTLTLPGFFVFKEREIYYNQGISAVVSRVLSLPIARFISLGLEMALIIGVFWLIYAYSLSLNEAVLLTLPVILLIEPLAWQHHYVFLFPIFVYLYTKLSKSRLLMILLVLSYLLVSFNIKNPSQFLAGALHPIVLSHVFIGNVIAFCLLIYTLHTQKKQTVTV